MNKEFTKTEYYDYMKVVDGYIKDAEMMVNNLPKYKEIRQLSFEDWVKFQNGEKIKMSNEETNIKVLTDLIEYLKEKHSNLPSHVFENLGEVINDLKGKDE